MEDRQLTIEQIAERAQVGEATVRAWLARGLEHTDEDGVVLVQVSDLDAFLASEGQGKSRDATA